MATAVLVSKRPALVNGASERAWEWADRLIVRIDTGDFLYALRESFGRANGPAIKVDDDDTYASDHHKILQHYRGKPVWNMVKRYGCDGRFLGWRSILSGGVIPPGLFDHAELDDRGMVEPWVRAHHGGETVWAGTIGEVCPARWLWQSQPTWLNRIRCRH